MSSLIRPLRTVRVTLAAGVALRGFAWGLAAALSLVAASALVDLAVPLSLTVRTALLFIAAAGAASVTLAMWWRDRAVLSLDRVALWIEEHFPSLEYRLITAVETGDSRLLTNESSDHWASTARRRAARVLGVPMLAVIVAFIVVLVIPGGAVARMGAPHAGDALDRAGRRAADASKLTPLVAEVSPPTYISMYGASFTVLRPTIIEEPSDVRAVVGSTVVFRGRGDAAGIVAMIGRDSLAAVSQDDRWSITLRVRATPVAIRLRDRRYDRIVAIEPIIDEPPTVTLLAPARDSVLRKPTGTIALAADVNDDFGIATSSFEYIVSSGEGETFKFKSGTIGMTKGDGRRASISARLSLDQLGLAPGDIVHLRAVARDANDVTGPGIGVSETRAIRIARADEYDSVAVEAAAPTEEDKGMISERMLIMLAEALQKKRPALSKNAVVGESRSIAVDQKRLRRTVGEIVFTRLGGDPSGEEHKDEDSPTRAKTMEEMLARADSATNKSIDPIDFEGGESPVVAVNKPLLEAYNAMWDASTALEIGEPDHALPHMRRALAAIQRARLAERLYLRGAPPRVVIDLNSVRLKGKDKGSSSHRRPLGAADSVAQERMDRFARAVELSARNPAAAIDSLLMLRVDALVEVPTFASALSDAVAAMRKTNGAEASRALARARRALAGSPMSVDSLGKWSGVP